jgi:hypothetical protein
VLSPCLPSFTHPFLSISGLDILARRNIFNARPRSARLTSSPRLEVSAVPTPMNTFFSSPWMSVFLCQASRTPPSMSMYFARSSLQPVLASSPSLTRARSYIVLSTLRPCPRYLPPSSIAHRAGHIQVPLHIHCVSVPRNDGDKRAVLLSASLLRCSPVSLTFLVVHDPRCASFVHLSTSLAFQSKTALDSKSVGQCHTPT